MELTISKRSFLRGLARTHAVADRKSSMPILSNVLLATDGDGLLRLAATDLFLAVNASVDATVRKAGTVAIAARTLFDIVKNLPEGDVTLSVLANQGTEIRSGKVRYKVPGMPGTDFPALPSPGETGFSEIPLDILAELVSRTHFSMSSDDTRPHLAATLFEADGKAIRMVTTDGHRLSKAERKFEGGHPFSMLVPARGIAEIKRILEDARAEKKTEDKAQTLGVAHAGAAAFFRREGIQLSVKLADEQFPPYGKVIPQSASRRVVLSRVLLTEALKRISLVASDKSGGIRIAFEEGKLRITSENPEVGEGSEEVDVDFAGSPVTIGFNARYLLDVLGALPDDSVALEVSGERDPGVVRPAEKTPESDFVGVIMPMRI